MENADIVEINDKIDILISRYKDALRERDESKIIDLESINAKDMLNIDEINYLKSEIKARDAKIDELYDELNRRNNVRKSS